jgi:hypothetical protein
MRNGMSGAYSNARKRLIELPQRRFESLFCWPRAWVVSTDVSLAALYRFCGAGRGLRGVVLAALAGLGAFLQEPRGHVLDAPSPIERGQTPGVIGAAAVGIGARLVERR